MNSTPEKNKLLSKRRSSSASISTKQKSSDVVQSAGINRTTTSYYETVSHLKSSSKQNSFTHPRSTLKPVAPDRNTSKKSLKDCEPPPVKPRTNLPQQTKLKPIAKERKSLKKINDSNSDEVQRTIPATREKSAKSISTNNNNTKQILSNEKISTTSTITSSTPYTPGLCGLINIGNTCFMNSALQCLSNIPEFTQWAQDQKPDLPISNKDIISVYTSLIQSMWSGNNSRINPRDMKEIVSYSAPIFADYGQKDSHEFMNTLLNALEAAKLTSIITDLFYIHTQSQVTCSGCNLIDITDERTTFLPLPLPQETLHNKEILLEDLINDYCLEDNLDGLYYCHSCNNHTQAKQKTNIYLPLPHVLIIQLKRFPFDGTSHKINTFVRYKLQYENLISKNDIYQLCAISCHSGSLSSGHYTTLARNHITTQWYLFNDNQIDKINLDKVITNNAYVLVYLKSDVLDNSL